MISIRTFRIVLILLGLCLLAGCASTGVGSRVQKNYSGNDYLQMAAGAKGNTQQAYLLEAANQFVDERQVIRAQSILNTISDNTPPNLRIKKQLVSAKLLITYHQNDNALSALQAMNADHSSWTRKDQIEWYQIAANANENLGNLNASIQQQTNIIPLLDSREAKKRQLLSIWQNLENISSARIKRLLSQATTPAVRGWLSLAVLTNRINTSPQELTRLLQRWKSEYPGHPATALLPSSLKKLNNIPPDHPKRIALLLPLQGQYARAGNAVKNGFFAAYYNEKSRGQSTPNIIVIDTSHKNILTAYQEAINRGARFVVGPLTKKNILTLTQSTRLAIPTLALNKLPSLEGRSINNLFQFGLSPLDEAKQAAMRAWSAHQHSAMIIAPKNTWGQSIANAFEKTWKSLGGKTVARLAYTNQKNLSEEVRRLLNIDQANWREAVLKKVLREKIRYIPRRRKDADMIFMVASSNMARQIRPMLRYYYAGNIPTYSTSSIYPGQPNTHRDRDLNGIRFPDMPWVLNANMKPNTLNAIRRHVRRIWPQSYASQPKLFALGIDAYDIIPKLNKMAMLPELGTPAATGTLYLNKNNYIYRKLIWFKMKNGTPHRLK